VDINKRVDLICILLFVGAATGCSRKVMTFREPSGKAEVTIGERFFFDEGINIEVRTPLHSTVAYSSPRQDWLPGFTEVAWRQDPDRAIVLTCNQYGGSYSPVVLAFNLKTWRVENGPLANEEIAAEVRSKYEQARRQSDPIAWACSQEGADAFHKVIR
jgi:hypothetical protein